MAAPQTTRRRTEAEYLAIERAAETKSEFYEGEMFAMAGGTRSHSRICMNLAREFGNKLLDHRYQPFNTDLRIKIEASGLYTYPDLSVVCGEDHHVDEEKDTPINPTVIVEMLSDSTEAYGRGKNSSTTGQIPSLKEYVLVSQNQPRVEQFIRQANNEWLLREAFGLNAMPLLSFLEITISLAEVFRNVKIGPKPVRPEPPLRN
ncbi:MAG TPA: Uma2 family endonuclease [Candidatus Limnocylindria bacterium]|nr:Uma2 family endonuclease [Candidatus Limnocylindria bacterium]